MNEKQLKWTVCPKCGSENFWAREHTAFCLNCDWHYEGDCYVTPRKVKPAPPAPPSNVPAEAAGETPLLDAATELLEVSDLRGDSEMPNPCDDPKLWTSRAQEAWENLRIAVDEKEAEKPAPASPQPSREAREAAAVVLRIEISRILGIVLGDLTYWHEKAEWLNEFADWLEAGINDEEGK